MTTINSIYYHHTDLHPVPSLVEKSSIYNQQQEHRSHNYTSSDRMSKAYHDIPLIMPSVGGSAVATDFQPQQKSPQMSSAGNRLNNSGNDNVIFNRDNSIHMTDVDTDDSGSGVEAAVITTPKMTYSYEKLDVPHGTNVFADMKFSDTGVQPAYEKSTGSGGGEAKSK